MGNDGGTIVKRLDIVRVRDNGGASSSSVDPAILARIQATTCAISHQTLRLPVVADRMGRLYNKESVVKFLLKRAEDSGKTKSPTKSTTFNHLRSMKDVQTVTLTVNPAYSKVQGTRAADDADAPTPFICPLNQREMNGHHRFIFLRTCGCVMSESGLRAIVMAAAIKGKKVTTSTDDNTARSTCPVCSAPFSADVLAKKDAILNVDSDIVIINGTQAEIQRMLDAQQEARRLEQARKKEAKAAKAANSNELAKRKHHDEEQQGNRSTEKDAQEKASESTKRHKAQHDQHSPSSHRRNVSAVQAT